MSSQLLKYIHKLPVLSLLNLLKLLLQQQDDSGMYNTKLLTPEEVREYCNKLFKFKRTNAATFRFVLPFGTFECCYLCMHGSEVNIKLL